MKVSYEKRIINSESREDDVNTEESVWEVIVLLGRPVS